MPHKTYVCKYLPDLGRRILVMGILNITPDSFSDDGLFDENKAACDHALAMVQEGADILDIGGESTRPGAVTVPMEEEIARIVPVISTIAGLVDIPISIDTYKSATARAALKAGAKIINDVWGLQHDPKIADVAAEYDAPIVIMHNRAETDPTLDILDDMRHFFDVSLDISRRAGVPDSKIILDPGIGFGKTQQQHFDILLRMDKLKALGFPVLIGASRKSMIGNLVNRPPRDRLAGTLAVHTLAAAGGADIVRVHDVAEHLDAARIVDALNSYRSGNTPS